VTRLRKMMLEELQRRNYSAITTRNYLRVVADFAKYFGKSPGKLGPNELRTYQAYLLQDRKLTPGTVVNRNRRPRIEHRFRICGDRRTADCFSSASPCPDVSAGTTPTFLVP
jgi:hypothetical protein